MFIHTGNLLTACCLRCFAHPGTHISRSAQSSPPYIHRNCGTNLLSLSNLGDFCVTMAVSDAAPPSAAEQQLKAATEVAAKDPVAGTAALKAIVLDDSSNDAEGVKVKEQAIAQLCDLYVKQQDAQSLADLLSSLRSFFNAIPKAKTAKLVRSIIDSIAKVPGSTQLQVRSRSVGGRSWASTSCPQLCEKRFACA